MPERRNPAFPAFPPRTIVVVLALVLLFSPVARAGAESRVALVIGNSAYQHTHVLENPGNDAAAVAGVLRRVGFDVTLRTDLDRRGLAAAFRDFGDKASTADIALLYYAGHGLQVANGNKGENYLVPVDAQLADVRDVDDEAFSLDRAIERLEGARSRIVILDACRDNPLANQMRGTASTRSVSRGLARADTTSRGTLIVFSTEPGAVALDGAGGADANSPFAAALVRFLPQPGLEVRQMLTRVRADVNRQTDGKQTPWSSDGLFEDLFLVAPSVTPPPSTVVPSPTPEPSAAERARIEEAYWASVKDSTDRRDLDDYLKQFPDGMFAPLARNRLDRLTAPSPTPAPTATAPTPAPPAHVSTTVPPQAVAPSPVPTAPARPVARVVPPATPRPPPEPATKPRPQQTAELPPPRPSAPVAGEVTCLMPSGASEPMSRARCRDSLGIVMR